MRPAGATKKAVTIKQRIRIVSLYESNYTHRQIARKLEISQKTVRKWLKRWATQGSLEDATHPGRPIKHARAMMQRVQQLMRGRQGASSRKVARKLTAEGTPVSHTTVQHIAHALNMHPYARPRKPLLTPTFKTNRLRFARASGTRDWRAVIAADEKRFSLFDTPNRRNDVVWGRRGDPIPPSVRAKHSVHLNVYAAIAHGGRSTLYIFDSNLDAALYIRILEKVMLPAAQRIFGRRRWTYLADKDPKHTSRQALTWLENNKIQHFGDSWPANSPDLNPIENMWSILRDAVLARNPTTKQQLRTALRVSWKSIDQTIIDNCMDSMPSRMRAVISAKGGHTNY